MSLPSHSGLYRIVSRHGSGATKYISESLKATQCGLLSHLTFASCDTVGLGGKSTVLAFNIVFCSKMDAWERLCPNGCKDRAHSTCRKYDVTGQHTYVQCACPTSTCV